MHYSSTIQNFPYGHHKLQLYVPAAEAVRTAYLAQKKVDANTPLPYWAQVWPAAAALAQFVYEKNHLVKNRQVLELAAGLGLPSMVAGLFAQTVCASDYLPQPLAYIQASAKANGLTNLTTRLLNWNHLPENLTPEVLLLSDINYEPAAFDTLLQVLLGFIQKGTTILLSTPQRLMAKPFIGQLLPYCKEQYDYEGVSVFVL